MMRSVAKQLANVRAERIKLQQDAPPIKRGVAIGGALATGTLYGSIMSMSTGSLAPIIITPLAFSFIASLFTSSDSEYNARLEQLMRQEQELEKELNVKSRS